MKFSVFAGVILIWLLLLSSGCVNEDVNKPITGSYTFYCSACRLNDVDNSDFYVDSDSMPVYNFTADGTGAVVFPDNTFYNFTWKMVDQGKYSITFVNPQNIRPMKYPRIIDTRGGYVYYSNGQLRDADGFRFLKII
jgi:hypothetical protein